jgi:hypothetical protein
MAHKLCKAKRSNRNGPHLDIDGSATISKHGQYNGHSKLLPQRYLSLPNPLSSPEPTSISAPDSGAEMCKISTLTYKIKLRANSKYAEIVIVPLHSGLFHLSVKHNMHHRDDKMLLPAGIGLPPGGDGLRGGE